MWDLAVVVVKCRSVDRKPNFSPFLMLLGLAVIKDIFDNRKLSESRHLATVN